jgi:hypothetical protein
VSVLSPAPPLSTGQPMLRLLPVPPSEPPYDDELPGYSPDRLPAPVRAPLRRTAPALRLVPALPAEDEDDDGPARTPRAQLPPPRPFAHALVQRALEVCAGLRPLSQLQRDTTLELYDEIDRLLRGRPRVTGARPARAAVRSVHVQEHPEGVAEVCATVLRGGRAGAIALRLEGINGSWRCTQLVGL